MGREAKPHLNSGKWRFRWSVVASTEQDVRDQAAKLRRLTVAGAELLKPVKVDDEFRLSWAVVRAEEAEAWSEFARYKGLDASSIGERPRTIVGMIEAWEAEFDAQYADTFLLDPLDRWKGTTLLETVTSNFLDKYARHLETLTKPASKKNAPKYSPETRRQMLRKASGVFKYAAEEGWISKAPLPAHATEQEPTPKAMSRKEIADAYRALHNPRAKHIIPMLRLCAATGMRMGEVRQLRWDRVDLDRRTITLPPKAHKSGGKTGKNRIIRLSEKAVGILRRQIGATVNNHPVSDSTWAFISKRTGKPYSRDGLNAILYRQGINPHRLRHSFAQRAIDAGIAPQIVSRMLGHEKSEMVWVYAEIKDESVHAAVASLEAHERSRPPVQSLKLVPDVRTKKASGSRRKAAPA